MTPDQRERARKVFLNAIAESGEARQRYLADVCRGNLDLRLEVESLLRCHDQSGDFLSTPAFSYGVSEGVERELHLIGTQIGQFSLQEVIARGGMGIVYKAIQDEPRREVAIKVMRRGLASQSVLRRFRDEAQILARLRHPNIAQVYEADTHMDESARDDGEPIAYFAMEYVPMAKNITEYAGAHDLSIHDRLSMFVKVCEAIHHGHQKGIIHRDIKPANILVDVEGEPKVIDFGVARTTDSDLAVTTQRTVAGQLIGTLQYMSPEQCDGDPTDIDSRSDVFSLGAVLYELLSGQPAYDTTESSILHAVRMIRETIPPPLSRLHRQFRGDLETIVSKAMEKDRERRYQSAEALKSDLEHHLAGEPIEARPTSGWIKTTRWMGQHPMLTAGVGSAFIASLTFVITLAAVRYGLRQPARFWISPDGSVAHLVTTFGRPLATLGELNAQVRAVLWARPQRFGGGEVALTVVSSGQHSTRRQLWLCDPNDLDTPVWATASETPSTKPEMPPDLEGSSSDLGYYVQNFWVVDVFSELDGDEIITVQAQDSDSPHVVRILDFGGNVLFEVWHLGYVADVYWWQPAGLLVGIGDRHGESDITSHNLPAPPPWPRVVWAICPQPGDRVGWLNERDWPAEWRNDARVDQILAWYKVLDVHELKTLFWASKITDAAQVARGDPTILVSFQSNEKQNFNLRLNSHGEVVGLIESDEFQRLMGESRAPRPTLVDWPPITPGN